MTKHVNVWNFVIVALNVLLHYMIHRDLSSVVIAILTYPLGLFVPIWVKKDAFSELPGSSIERSEKFRSSKYMESMPLRVISKLGSAAQKKAAILELKELVKKGVEVKQNMKVLVYFLSSDNQDVALYASEAVNEIESFYIDKIASLEHATNPQDIVEFCRTVLNVIKTDLIVGQLKDYYEDILIQKAKLVKDRFPDEYYKIMYEATSDIDYLEKGFEKTSSLEFLSMLFTQSIKHRKYDIAREISIRFPNVVKEAVNKEQKGA
ncbi:hypothetical protein [Mesoaciditoga sp.]